MATAPKRTKAIRSGKGEGASGGGWEIVYTGFILILLCFFIMLCAFSTIQTEEARVMRFVKSFTNAISVLSGGLKLLPGDVVLPESPEITPREEMTSLYGALESYLNRSDLAGEVAVTQSGGRINMRLSDRQLFGSGSAEIAPGAADLLRAIGAMISRTPFNVRIEGHTDNVPIHTERFPSNWELSTARAVNVLRFLLGNSDIPITRLSAVGYGEYHPLVPNDTPAHRARNRRVEIILSEPPERKAPGGEEMRHAT